MKIIWRNFSGGCRTNGVDTILKLGDEGNASDLLMAMGWDGNKRRVDKDVVISAAAIGGETSITVFMRGRCTDFGGVWAG